MNGAAGFNVQRSSYPDASSEITTPLIDATKCDGSSGSRPKASVGSDEGKSGNRNALRDQSLSTRSQSPASLDSHTTVFIPHQPYSLPNPHDSNGVEWTLVSTHIEFRIKLTPSRSPIGIYRYAAVPKKSCARRAIGLFSGTLVDDTRMSNTRNG